MENIRYCLVRGLKAQLALMLGMFLSINLVVPTKFVQIMTLEAQNVQAQGVFIYIISVLFCYAFMHVCLLMPCGHLLGKG